MYVLIMLALHIGVIAIFVNKQSRNRFQTYDWMTVPFLILVLPKPGFAIFHSLIYGILILLSLVVFCFLNPKQLGVIVFTLGFALNKLVRVVNNGYMPVDLQAYKQYAGELANLSAHETYIFITDTTKLSFLGDWLYFPYAGGVFSPGDVIIDIGSLILVVQYIKFRYKQARF